MGFWPLVLRVIREANVVLIVIDARMPGLSKNSEVEDIAKRLGKRVIYVFNKCDLISNDTLNSLRKQNPGAFFVSATIGRGIKDLKTKLVSIGGEIGFDVTKVGVVGYPNVGKSAIINSLVGARENKVAAFAGTTRRISSVRERNLKIIDTPGVIPSDDKESKLAIIAAKNPEKIKNLEKVAIKIIELFLGQNPDSLSDFYGIRIDGSSYDLFLEIGKKRGFLLKKGVIDEHRTAMQIIVDWQKGKIRL